MLLALDTVFSACSVALATPDGEILDARHQEQSRGQAETLVPMVEGLLNKTDTPAVNISKIIVTTGPGTFAGVRVGIAFARSLALTTGASVLGISSFEALAGLAALDETPAKNESILTVMPGKRGEASLLLFAVSAEAGFPPKVLKNPETIPESRLAAWVKGTSGLAIGPRLAGLPGLEGFMQVERWITASDLVKIAGLYSSDAFAVTVHPFYLRPPDATPQKSPIDHG